MRENQLRIGIYGGSFSPVHIGHIGVAESVLRSGLVDKVMLMPCKRNPLKSDSPEFSDDKRMEWLRSAVSYFNSVADENLKGRLEICDLELTMDDPSYTYKTMEKLSEKYPDTEFSLIMGADSYRSFPKWRESEQLEKKYRIIVYPRPGYEVVKNINGRRIVIMPEERLFEVSSTRIRDSLKNGEIPLELMPWKISF